jgi:hypothetical protein
MRAHTTPSRPPACDRPHARSITAGYCNLCKETGEVEFSATDSVTASTPPAAAWASAGFGGSPGGVDAESFAHSWAHLICDTLGAECHNQAWSGYGMVMNCCGGATLMSDVWKRTLATVTSADPASDPHGTAASNAWEFKSWKPDGVVINLGTNDQLGGRPQLVPAYNATYLALVEDAAAAYGAGTTFFLACGPMSTSYCDEVGGSCGRPSGNIDLMIFWKMPERRVLPASARSLVSLLRIACRR